MFCDASGYALGTHWGPHWAQCLIPAAWRFEHNARQSSAALEIRAVLLAALCWAPRWEHGRAVIFTDNQAAVAAFRCRHSPTASIASAIRALSLLEARFNVEITLQWTPGQSNSIADAISRGQVDRFFALLPHAARQPSQPLRHPMQDADEAGLL